MRVWDPYLSERDRALSEKTGYPVARGLRGRIALVVVDVTYAFTGPADTSLLEAIEVWPDACGPDAWSAIPRIRRLLDAFHEDDRPVWFSRPRPRHLDGRGALEWRGARSSPHAPVDGIDGTQIVAEVAPRRHDVVIEKNAPSAFFGTELIAGLVAAGINTVIVCGGTTSGCVRSTVVDAFSYGLRVLVAEDACFDRGEASHAVSLFDMDSRYAEVLPVDDLLPML